MRRLERSNATTEDYLEWIGGTFDLAPDFGGKSGALTPGKHSFGRKTLKKLNCRVVRPRGCATDDR
jgi:hypothetical protein